MFLLGINSLDNNNKLKITNKFHLHISPLVEPEEKKMTHIFYFIAFLILMIMLLNKQMLNNETLRMRIPKW